MRNTADEIKRRARYVREMYPRLTTGAFVNSGLRAQLSELAEACGLPYALSSKATDNDLISVALVAAKDAEGGVRVAQRIAMRLDDTLLHAPPVVPEPQWAANLPIAPEPPPTPSARTEPPSVPLDAIRTLIAHEVRQGALLPLQAALEAMARETEDAISKVTDTATERALAAMGGLIAEEAHKAASAALKALAPVRLDVVTSNAPEPVSLGLVHRNTPQIISALAAGVNVYLHGPAGSGKTTVARKAADAFGLKFYFAAKVESEYQLMGFKDAKGDTVRTPFREAYEHGGVFLFDEMDASSPSAVVALNAALANGICPFPDSIINRHADFYCVGAGNTKLTGANRQYAGRNQLDAASIDRFAFIEFGYDNDLERALASDMRWCEYVQAVRAAVAARGLNHLVTPRATYDGCKLLEAGFDWDTVAQMVVFKGLDADTRRQIETAVKAH